jgi:hypothetical protein
MGVDADQGRGTEEVTKSSRLPFDLAEVLQRFASDSDLVAKLVAKSDTFLSLCEDYTVARAALRRFEASCIEQQAKIEDYRSLVAELERDIESALNEVKGAEDTT